MEIRQPRTSVIRTFAQDLRGSAHAIYSDSVEATQQVVYFHPRDYAGPVRRMISFIIDLLFIIFLLMFLLAGAAYPFPPDVKDRMNAAPDTATRNAIRQEYFAQPTIQKRQGLTMRFWFFVAVAYHIALRRTRGGTVGYRLTGMRLIDCHNQPPPLRVLVKRFFLATATTLPFGISYFQCMKNPRRQAMHDRWCNTWMVRRDAVPAGPGMLVHQVQVLRSWAVRYFDVEPQGETPPAAPAAESEVPSTGTPHEASPQSH